MVFGGSFHVTFELWTGPKEYLDSSRKIVVPNSEFPRGAKDLITVGFQLVAPPKKMPFTLRQFNQGGL